MLLLSSLALAAAPPPAARLSVVSPAAVVAGAPFEVAVVLSVPEGWHVYWENPGQSGLATDLRLTARAADGTLVPVAGPRWPIPTRFVSDGLVTYGYEGDAAFVFTVPAPGPLVLGAEGTWLLCRDVCVAGAGVARARVRERRSPPRGADPVTPLLARLPTPFPTSGGAASHVDGRLRVTLPGPGPFDVFPSVALEGAWSPELAVAPDGGLLLESPLPAVPAGAHLVVTRGAGDARVGFTLDLPESPP